MFKLILVRLRFGGGSRRIGQDESIDRLTAR
jgi:hypothetical protein